MMRILAFTVVFFAMMHSCFAQRETRDGYIITLKGDTLKGHTQKHAAGSSFYRISFIDTSGVSREYGPGEIRAFQFGNDHYESIFIVKYVLGLDTDAGFYLFAKQVVNGPVKVYRRTYEAFSSDEPLEEGFYLSKGNGKALKVKRSVFGSRIRNRKQVIRFFHDDPSLCQQIATNKLSYYHIKEIALQYNTSAKK